jgi:excisionase family DNA binding protein
VPDENPHGRPKKDSAAESFSTPTRVTDELELLTVDEAVELVPFSRCTVYDRLASGEWDAFAFKVGKSWRIEKAGLMDYRRSPPPRVRKPRVKREPPDMRVKGSTRKRSRADRRAAFEQTLKEANSV